jgi:mono/diheme cytochrome c family protein
MRKVAMKRSWRGVGLSAMVLGIVAMASVMLTNNDAGAWPPYLDEWKDTYPDSTLPQRMEATFGQECYVCHNPGGFSMPGNCYREDLRDLLFDGYTILEALDIADGMDSDGDGFTNGQQITMEHAELPGEIGYNPGLSGCFGNDTCSIDPSIHWTGVSESPAVSPAKTGDLNCDGVVDGGDLLILLSNWGTCPSGPGACIADLNDSGIVDGADLLILLSNWG